MIDNTETQAQFCGMRWSETRTEFAKAFAKAQSELRPILKDTKNDFFKSKYADLSAVLASIMPALNANGISLIQAPAFDGHKVSITTMLLHASGEYMETTLDMVPTKKDPQGVGSCITYGRRYAALSVAGVAPEDDDGNAASQPQKGQTLSGQVLTSQMLAELRDYIVKLDRDEAKFLQFMHGRGVAVATTLEDVPIESYKAMQATLAGLMKKQGDANAQSAE